MATGTINNVPAVNIYSSFAQLGLSASTSTTDDVYQAMPNGSIAILDYEADSAVGMEIGLQGGCFCIVKTSVWHAIGMAMPYNAREFKVPVNKSKHISWSNAITFTIP